VAPVLVWGWARLDSTGPGSDCLSAHSSVLPARHLVGKSLITLCFRGLTWKADTGLYLHREEGVREGSGWPDGVTVLVHWRVWGSSEAVSGHLDVRLQEGGIGGGRTGI